METSKFEQAQELQNKIASTKRKMQTLIEPRSPLSICRLAKKDPYFYYTQQDFYQEWELTVDDRQCLLNHYEMILMNYEKEFEAI